MKREKLFKWVGFCLFLLVTQQVRADWYFNSMKLKITERKAGSYVSLFNLCKTSKCSTLYQWSQFRVIIKNPKSLDNGNAILSSLTQVAIINGKIFELSSPVLSEPGIGYLIPIEFSQILVAELNLGKIESDKKIIPQPEIQKAVFKSLVIDPGHGGNDVGTSSNKLLEKDITLFYALYLRDEIKKAIPDLDIKLTREKDEYVSLNDRAQMANSKNADLFLSLHINHAPNSKIFGAETYILNPNATDDDAKKTALLENDIWFKALKESGKSDGKSHVLKILAEMEQTKYIQRSAVVASYVQQELSELNATLGLKNRGVKQAMFYVLSQVAMPSVLVEMGFLSNAADRSRLMDLKFRDEFTQKIVIALKRYKNQ